MFILLTCFLLALISRILVVDPSKRITIDDIKADEWFKINNETPSLMPTSPSMTHSPPSVSPSTSSSSVVDPISPTFQSIEEEERDEHDDSLPNVVINGLTVTNAFDLIALSGVLGIFFGYFVFLVLFGL